MKISLSETVFETDRVCWTTEVVKHKQKRKSKKKGEIATAAVASSEIEKSSREICCPTTNNTLQYKSSKTSQREKKYGKKRLARSPGKKGVKDEIGCVCLGKVWGG